MAAEELPVRAFSATLQVRAARLHSCQHHPASKSSRERMLQDYLFFYLSSFFFCLHTYQLLLSSFFFVRTLLQAKTMSRYYSAKDVKTSLRERRDDSQYPSYSSAAIFRCFRPLLNHDSGRDNFGGEASMSYLMAIRALVPDCVLTIGSRIGFVAASPFGECPTWFTVKFRAWRLD